MARGRDYAARYLPESFLCLSESIDLHAVEADRIRVPVTLVAVREDQLVPLADMRHWLAGCRVHACTKFHPSSVTTPFSKRRRS